MATSVRPSIIPIPRSTANKIPATGATAIKGSRAAKVTEVITVAQREPIRLMIRPPAKLIITPPIPPPSRVSPNAVSLRLRLALISPSLGIQDAKDAPLAKKKVPMASARIRSEGLVLGVMSAVRIYHNQH